VRLRLAGFLIFRFPDISGFYCKANFARPSLPGAALTAHLSGGAAGPNRYAAAAPFSEGMHHCALFDDCRTSRVTLL
jgi:hypothetical protein